MSEPEFVMHVPPELVEGKLRRIGEGIGRVVYASEHWVIKRERSAREVIALIVIWRLLRRLQRKLPFGLGDRLLQTPAKQIRLLRIVIEAVMRVLPRSLWYGSNIRAVWKLYHRRNIRGARLAQEYLTGTPLIPRQIEFPPVRVVVDGWPGWLIASYAEERAECTLHQKLAELARAGRFTDLDMWLERFLALRQKGWSHGLFSVDPHVQNFGICGDRVFLLDSGGLTNSWTEIRERLSYEETLDQPHVQLGLGTILADRPDLAASFNARWRATVNEDVLQRIWPGPH